MEYSDTLPPCKKLDFGTRFVIHLCAYCAYILVLQLFLLLDSGKVLIPGNKPYSLMHVHTHLYHDLWDITISVQEFGHE